MQGVETTPSPGDVSRASRVGTHLVDHAVDAAPEALEQRAEAPRARSCAITGAPPSATSTCGTPQRSQVIVAGTAASPGPASASVVDSTRSHRMRPPSSRESYGRTAHRAVPGSSAGPDGALPRSLAVDAHDAGDGGRGGDVSETRVRE